jgi:hypothetical protein
MEPPPQKKAKVRTPPLVLSTPGLSQSEHHHFICHRGLAFYVFEEILPRCCFLRVLRNSSQSLVQHLNFEYPSRTTRLGAPGAGHDIEEEAGGQAGARDEGQSLNSRLESNQEAEEVRSEQTFHDEQV